MKPVDDAGPIGLPNPPTGRQVPVVERLRGHCSSRSWLAVGLDPAVDKLREAHVVQRDRLASAVADVARIGTAFAEEDRDHDERLRQAQRSGKPVAGDKRTPLAEREAIRRDAQAVMWASAEVLAEVVTETLAALKAIEPRILAELRERAAAADARIRAAEAEVRAAQTAHFGLLRTGQWIKACVDDGPFGAQPAPVPGAPVPPNVRREAVAGALTRAWHEQEQGAVA